MRYPVLAALAAVFVAPAWGQGFNQLDERYLYLQADYIEDAELESGGATEDGDGYGAKAVISMSPHAFVSLDYHSIDNSDGDLDTGSFGLGLRTAVIRALDFYGSAHYEHIDLTISGLGAGDTQGVGGRLGLRLFLGERLELSAEGRWADFGDEYLGGGADTEVNSSFAVAGAVFRFTDALAFTAEYLTGEYELEGGINADVERDDLRLGLRWYLDV